MRLEIVSQQLRELLATFQCQARECGQDILAYSALALGTDQLFVKIALEVDIPVELVIPCSQYAEIFSTTEARDEYHRLLSRCQDVHRLPFDDCVGHHPGYALAQTLAVIRLRTESDP